MPQKNRVFPYVANAYYHVYNRGVNKQSIFLQDEDCRVFRNIVREQLRKDQEVSVSAFALMENHFHFLLFQRSERAITGFMRSISIRYVMYLRKKYDRTGQLFESGFRAVPLLTDRAIEAARKYILLNPIEAGILRTKHVGIRI